MSEEPFDGFDNDHADDMRRWLAIGNWSLLVILLFATTILLVLTLVLRSDVAVLEEQGRKSAKTMKAMQEELATLRARAEEASAAAPAEAPAAAPAATAPATTNIDAATPGQDCVVRPGDKDGLANCIKYGPKGKR